ncbi:hypothetical protein FOPE_06733 [Fonsecaea pedrosoi]|nr:hypothetical protein FOPE_06733 [Fonsecaea pedrosoi]
MAAEVVLGAVGLLPVILEVLRSYRDIHDKVRTFRNCCQELAWIQTRLKTQKLKFFYNCERLIRIKLEQNEELEDLIDLSTQKFWFDESANKRVRDSLGRITVDLLQDIVAEIQTILNDFDNDLQCLDVIKSERVVGESLQKAFRRLRQGFTIVFEKSRFSRNLDRLQSRNKELKSLIEDSIDWSFHEQRRRPTKSKDAIRSSVAEYNIVQRVAGKLHEALNEAWCCNGLGHTHHYAKLCVGVQVNRGVRLDLAISYGKHGAQDTGNYPAEEHPTWLYIQSSTTEAGSAIASQKRARSSEESDTESDSPHARVRYHAAKVSAGDHHPSRHDASGPSNLLGSCAPSSISGPATGADTIFVDLCQSDNVCRHLTDSPGLGPDDKSSQCLGYLESSDQFRHLFYSPKPEEALISQTTAAPSRRFLTLNEVFRLTDNATLDPRYKVQLALNLTKAVLCFHQTPWLREGWQIHDFAFFDHRTKLSDIQFNTLHLTSQLTECRAQPPSLSSAMEGVQTQFQLSFPPTPHLVFDRGVDNLTLFNLGVALLQIVCWKPLGELGQGQNLDDIHLARKISLSDQASVLGPKFKDIVRKCLRCEFGSGTNLEDENLKGAVAAHVIPTLESMMKAMSI